MQRYFIESKYVYNDHITILEDDTFHIKNVMRMNVGDEVIVQEIDNEKNTYLCKIELIDKKTSLKIIKILDEDNELCLKVTIAHGFVKKDKQEEVIRRLVELGAYAYLPTIMEKSNIKLDKLKNISSDRLNKIIKEASEQSERKELLKVLDTLSFNDLLSHIDDYDLVLYCSVKDKDDLKDKLNNVNLDAMNILVIIGPEAGMSQDEMDKLESMSKTNDKVKAISLGKRILRTEMACIYIMSVLGYLGEHHE